MTEGPRIGIDGYLMDVKYDCDCSAYALIEEISESMAQLNIDRIGEVCVNDNTQIVSRIVLDHRADSMRAHQELKGSTQ